MPDSIRQDDSHWRIMPRNRASRVFLIVLLFAGSLGLRLTDISKPPNFHVMREYRSAMIARSYYLGGDSHTPIWKKQIALANAQKEGLLEPPINESIMSLAYRALGSDSLIIPRVISSLYWLIAGLFLLLTLLVISSPDTAVILLAFFLYIPFGLVAGRSFQPDPLMVMFFSAGVFGLVRWNQDPSTRKLLLAGMACGLAILVKPVALLPLSCAFISLAWFSDILRKPEAKLRSATAFLTLAVLPAVSYYAYGFLRGRIGPQAHMSFIPRLPLHPFFWYGWAEQIQATVGHTLFLLALLGVSLRRRRSFPLLLGLLGGYAGFGLAFDYFTYTHDYYHLQLIPIVTLALAPMVDSAIEALRGSSAPTQSLWATRAVLALALVFALAHGREAVRVDDLAYRLQVIHDSEQIGERVAHSRNTIILDQDYGEPTKYYGWISGDSWPADAVFYIVSLRGMKPLGAKERLDQMSAKAPPDYFIITDMGEYWRQQDLRQLLTRDYPLVVKTDRYLIFDMRRSSRHRA